MKTAWCRVLESQRLYGDTYVLWLEGSEMARGATPGQFVMVRCTDEIVFDGDGRGGRLPAPTTPLTPPAYGPPLFARPMSYHRMRPSDTGRTLLQFAVLYEVVGRGTTWLSQRKPGDRVFVYGPLGRGYRLRRTARNLLLVAGGIGVAPLVWLADQAVAAERNVVMLIGARTASGVFPSRLLPPELELVVTTDDGSLGRKGLVTDVVGDYLSWADQVFACGPAAMFRGLAEVVRRFSAIGGSASGGEGEGARRGRKSVQVLLEEVMPCGTGICYGCGTMTRKGVKLICKDGPMFELRDVF